jgi:hypothetical protein
VVFAYNPGTQAAEAEDCIQCQPSELAASLDNTNETWFQKKIIIEEQSRTKEGKKENQITNYSTLGFLKTRDVE